jgi:hypothetical protein
MSSTTFIENQTVVHADWLNDVNTSTYTTVPGLSASVSSINTALTQKANAGPLGSSGITGAAASGVNTDITSLASPALGNATATTQTAGDNSTKVATTAFVTTATSGLQPQPPVQVRQTVLSGPVDTNGLPNFGGSAGSTTVTATGTLVATAANGVAATGSVDRVGSITNPSWTGLSTNGTMYLGLTIAANGTCTPFATTLAPIYQWGGTPANTSGQRTFNIQQMTMYAGSGAAAPQSYDVFVGEVTVAAGVVSAIVWYALMGRYSVPLTAVPAAATNISWNHNIGVVPKDFQMRIRCVTAANNNAVGDEFSFPNTTDPANGNLQPGLAVNAKVLRFQVNQVWVTDASTGSAVTAVSSANYNFTGFINRGW